MNRYGAYEVAVYIQGALKPVRVFDGYATYSDANAFAETLRQQNKRNGSTSVVRVRETADDYDTREYADRFTL